MTAIPPGKGSDWQEREAWVLNPPSMSDRDDPSPPGGTFLVPPVPDTSTPVPRNASSDHKTRDLRFLRQAGGTPRPPVAPEIPDDADEGGDEPDAWTSMTKHAELDQFTSDANITPSDDWATMTIAAKKEWLTNNYSKEV